ncbi:MAG: four helix bundle protein [Patescibacteria group bacterium]|jgi:four helix bundle protein
MASIRQFEDILAWQKSRILVREVYKALKPCNDRGFTDQIQRASVSVLSNIAEGFESGTKPEFINYLYIAKGSAGEVRAQLYVALDVGYIKPEIFKLLNTLVVECSRLIASFIKGLKTSEFGGQQFKKEKTKSEKDREEFEGYLQEQNRINHPEVFGEPTGKYKDYKL